MYGTVQGNPYGSSADKAFQVKPELGMRRRQRGQCTCLSVPCDEQHTRPSLLLSPLRAGHERAGHSRLCVSSYCVHVLLPCAAVPCPLQFARQAGAHHAVDQPLPQTPCLCPPALLCSYGISYVQLEVNDTVPPPSEGVMRKACRYAMAAALALYTTVAVIGCECGWCCCFAEPVLVSLQSSTCGRAGIAELHKCSTPTHDHPPAGVPPADMAFGDETPSMLLTGFSSPRWLLIIANVIVLFDMTSSYK